MKQHPITLVREFMQAFGQETPTEVLKEPSLEVKILRAKLQLEEVLESIRALGLLPYTNCAGEILMKNVHFDDDCYNYNPVEVLDGLCDSEYVGPAGTAVALGISEELFDKAFAEVHRSNMSKLWTDEEVLDIVGRCKEHLQNVMIELTFSWVSIGSISSTLTFIHTGTEEVKCWLVKDKDGKVIKSPSFSPPKLEELLREYAKQEQS